MHAFVLFSSSFNIFMKYLGKSHLRDECMSVGIVTFFKYTQLGFYRYGNDDYCEPLEMDTLLSS
ncbi:hypothetical protein DK723_24860, partial [Salmonella enterica subsp. enterica]|nr:hypothetical protein [Salmonella enterica subsp. enterica serovar Carno]